MAILNHGSTIRTADGGQSTTTIVTASNIGTYGVAANSTYFIGTTQNVFNRASGAQTLTGVSIDGNAANITAYTINQNVGTSNTPSFAGITSTAMLTSYTSLSNNYDWQNSPITIRERGLVSNGQSSDIYSPNINFHWAMRWSSSLWMNQNGNLNWGGYSDTGVPGNDGVFRTGSIYANIYYDKNDSTYYLDAANSGTSLLVAGNVGIGTTSASRKLIVNGDAAFATNSGGLVIASYDADTANIRPSVANGSVLISDDSNLLTRGTEFLNGGGMIIQSLSGFAPIEVKSNGSTLFYVTSAGNIGIGTTNPGYRLTVNGTIAYTPSAGNPVFIGNDATYGAAGTGRYVALGFGGLANSANKIFAHNMGEDGLYICSATSRSISFRAGGGATDHVVITSGGNLGVATTSADTNLQVVGHVHVGNQTTFENTGGWNKTIYLDGLVHARMRILGSAYVSGKNSATETSIWVDNSVAPYSGLTTNAGSFTINAGFTTLTNSARSPIFYDSDNTSYYVDPNSVSNLSSLRIFSAFDTASSDVYANMRVMRNNATTDGMYIGYGNSGSTAALTRIFGGGATTGELSKYSTYTLEPGSFRSPIFYDSDNTSYYIDAASTSVINAISIAGNSTFSTDSYLTFGPNSTWGSSIRIGGNGYTATGTEMASVVTTDGNLHLDAAKSTNGIYLNWYGGTSGVFFGNGSAGQAAFVSSSGNAVFNGVVDATQFRDASNTAYYTDPASTSNLYALTVNDTLTYGVVAAKSFSVSVNTSTYWTVVRPNGSSIATGYVYRITLCTTGTGTDTGEQYLLANVDSAGWVIKTVTKTGSGSNWPYVFLDAGVPKVKTDHASLYTVTVLVEELNSGNTGGLPSVFGLAGLFTSDNGTPKYRAGWFSSDNTLLHSGNYSGYSTFSGSVTSTYGNFTTPGLIIGDAQYGFYVVSGNVYYKSASGGVHYWRNIANNTDIMSLNNSGTLTLTGDVRAPVFYDSASTSYYCDPNGVSNLYGVAIRGDAGITNTDNQIFFWGTGNTTTSAIGFKANGNAFPNPTGAGDGYNTYLTMDTDGRGWVFRRGTGGTDFTAAYTSGWILNNGIWQANASMRSPIFYDSNDTNYYGDFASTSRLNILNLVSYGYINGQTLNGQSFFQWEGATFRNPADHTPQLLIRKDNSTTGINGFAPALALYNNNGADQTTVGMAFVSAEAVSPTQGNSVELAGIIAKKESSGTAGGWSQGSLNFFVKDFGTRRDVMSMSPSGVVTAFVDVRAPIFYDSNNTAFYCDPTATSNFTGLTVANTITGSISGNAGTATTLQTARNINGTSFNGSAAITTATWGTARTLTIGSTGKSVDGSAGVSWSLAEIGAAATNQTMFIGTTSVAINRASASQTLTGVSIDGNAATASNATQFGGEANTNFMRGLAGGTEANINNYTDNGFRTVAYTGHGKGLLSFNVGSSIGTVQHEYFYNIPTNGWRVRNKTDNTTWSSWGNIVMTDTNQGALTGTVITTGNSSGLSPTFSNLYAAIFYDAADSTYYLDPANTTLSLKTRSSIVINNASAPNNLAMLNIGYSGSGETRAIDIQGGWSGGENKSITFTHASGSTNIVAQINAQHNGPASRLRWGKLYHGGDSSTYTMELISESTTSAYLTVAGSVRAPIFYDSNDTNYYVDPASTSVMLYVRAANFHDSTGSYNVNLGSGNSEGRGLVAGYSGGSYGGIGYNVRHTTTGGSWIAPSTDTSTYLLFSNGIYFYYAAGGAAGRTLSYSTIGSLTSAGIFTVSGDVRAPLFYDSNNTAYYLDPASTSNLNVLNAVSSTTLWIRSGSWAGDLTSNGFTREIGMQMTGGSEFVILSKSGQGYTLVDGSYYAYEAGGFYSSFNSSYGAIVGFSADSTTSVTFNCNVKAPIFYDSNDTGYYIDAASTSSLNSLISTEVYARNWFRNNDSGEGIYNQATTQHFYSDDVSYWNVASSSGVQGIRFRTGGHGGTVRGYVYANDSNDVGLLNNGGNWRIRVVAGDYTIFDGSSVRAQTFIDSNNTAYYVDPGSTSNLNVLNVVDANLELYKSQTVDMSNTTTYSTSNYYPVTIPVPTEGCIIQIQNNLNSNVPSWATHGSGFTLNLKWRTNGFGWGTTQVRRIIDQYYELFTNQTICGGITQMGNSSTEVVWLRGGGQYYFKFSRNLSATAQSATYTVSSQSVSPTSTAQNTIWSSAGGSSIQYNDQTISTTNMYTPVLYDWNNSAYFVDPASTSNLVGLTVANTITGSITGNAGGSSASCTGNAATATRTSGQSGYPHAGTGMFAFYNWGGSDGGTSAPSASTYTTGLSVGSNPGDQAYGFQIANNMWNTGLWTRNYNSSFGAWIRLLDSSNYVGYSAFTSSLTSTVDVRGPVFYDSNDTAYYLDPAGTSNLNKLSAFTMSYNDMNSMHVNSPYVARYNGSALYRNGTMGYGTIDCNVMFSNWGSGFIDSWGSPANAPGGSTHYVGFQGFHYNHQDNSQAYGFQMLCAGEANNRFFWRSAWPTLRSWVEMIHSGNYNSFAPTLTGTGASGSWGISITGSSASCTGNAATATTATSSGSINSDTGNVGGNRLQYWQTSGNTTLNPDGEWYNAIRMGHGDPVTYYSNTLAVKMTGSNLGDIYTRTTTNGTAGTWNRFWNNNNDGAGSGLDADLLDGINSASFLRSDVSATNSVDLRSPIFYDSDNTAYYLDAANTTTSLLVAGSIGIGTTSPATRLHVIGTAGAARNVQLAGTTGLGSVFQLNNTVTALSRPVITLRNTQAGDTSSINRGAGIQFDLGYGGNSLENVGTRVSSGYITLAQESNADWTVTADRHSYLSFATISAGTVAERMRISSVGNVTINGSVTASSFIGNITKTSTTQTITGNSALTIDVAAAYIHIITIVPSGGVFGISSVTYNNRKAGPEVDEIILVFKWPASGSGSYNISNTIGDIPFNYGKATVTRLTSYKGTGGVWIAQTMISNIDYTNL